MVEPNLKRQLDFMEGELGRSEWFAGDEFTRRRHPDELSGRGGGAARRPRREPAEADGVPEEDPRPAGVPARARARRPLQLRQRLSARGAPAAAAARLCGSRRRRRLQVEARRPGAASRAAAVARRLRAAAASAVGADRAARERRRQRSPRRGRRIEQRQHRALDRRWRRRSRSCRDRTAASCAGRRRAPSGSATMSACARRDRAR